MRHLTFHQALTNLRLGLAIEQWIKVDAHEDYVIIHWLRIHKEKENFIVKLIQCFEEEDSFDICDFTDANEDLSDELTYEFDSAELAVEYAIKKYRCKENKFVNSGMIQEEYKDYLNGKRNN